MKSARKPKSRKSQLNTSFPWKKIFGKEHLIYGLSPTVLKKMLLILFFTAVTVRVGKARSHTPVPIHGTTNRSGLDKTLPRNALIPVFSVSFSAGCVFNHVPRYCVLPVSLWQGNPGKHCISTSLVAKQMWFTAC